MKSVSLNQDNHKNLNLHNQMNQQATVMIQFFYNKNKSHPHLDFADINKQIRGEERKNVQMDLLANGLSNVFNNNVIINKKNEVEGKKEGMF